MDDVPSVLEKLYGSLAGTDLIEIVQRKVIIPIPFTIECNRQIDSDCGTSILEIMYGATLGLGSIEPDEAAVKKINSKLFLKASVLVQLYGPFAGIDLIEDVRLVRLCHIPYTVSFQEFENDDEDDFPVSVLTTLYGPNLGFKLCLQKKKKFKKPKYDPVGVLERIYGEWCGINYMPHIAEWKGLKETELEPERVHSPVYFSKAGLMHLNIEHHGFPTAKLQFVLPETEEVFKQKCALHLSFSDIKRSLAKVFKVPPGIMQLYWNGDIPPDNLALLDLGIKADEAVEVKVVNTEGNLFHKHSFVAPEVEPKKEVSYRILPIIAPETGMPRNLKIRVEKHNLYKPYEGGYRDTCTNTVYHNAGIQTIPKFSDKKLFHRVTQKYFREHNVAQQTDLDNSTQVSRDDYYISEDKDKIVFSRPYKSYAENQDEYLRKIILLQSYWRRWLARREMLHRKDVVEKTIQWVEDDRWKEITDKEEWLKKEWLRQFHPVTDEDFELVFSVLHKWKTETTNKYRKLRENAPLKAAITMVLDRESHLRAVLDVLKRESQKLKEEKDVKDFLKKVSAPKKWYSKNNVLVSMETMNIVRARELKEVYNTIAITKKIPAQKRLCALLMLKAYIKDFDCDVCDELFELIDRESDMLARGVALKHLTWLRKRILTLFLVLMKNKTFNPQSKKFSKIPEHPSTLRGDLFVCRSCNRCLTNKGFNIPATAQFPTICIACKKLDSEARGCTYLGWYRHMLHQIRLKEQDSGNPSSIAFIMQASDLKNIVENIWMSQSALSGKDYYLDLRLYTWNVKEEWSPWNCVLLTVPEGKAHLRVEDLQKTYHPSFIQSVNFRHFTARAALLKVPYLAKHVLDRTANAVNEEKFKPYVIMPPPELYKPLQNHPPYYVRCSEPYRKRMECRRHHKPFEGLESLFANGIKRIKFEDCQDVTE